MAGMIRQYAKKAGGISKSSYYGLMLDELAAYHVAKAKSPPDSKRMTEAKQTVQEACNAVISPADKLHSDSAKLRAQLADFRSLTTDHWASLNALLEDLRRQLGKSEVRYLDGLLKPLQESSLHQRSEFENGE